MITYASVSLISSVDNDDGDDDISSFTTAEITRNFLMLTMTTKRKLFKS